MRCPFPGSLIIMGATMAGMPEVKGGSALGSLDRLDAIVKQAPVDRW